MDHSTDDSRDMYGHRTIRSCNNPINVMNLTRPIAQFKGVLAYLKPWPGDCTQSFLVLSLIASHFPTVLPGGVANQSGIHSVATADAGPGAVARLHSVSVWSVFISYRAPLGFEIHPMVSDFVPSSEGRIHNDQAMMVQAAKCGRQTNLPRLPWHLLYGNQVT